MNWLQFAWAAMASALLTLGLVHLFIWWKQRSQYAHLLFFAMTASIAAVAVFELMMMRATTAAGYATTLRWAHVPVSAVILSMVGFVYFYFDAGRVWLALTNSGYLVVVKASGTAFEPVAEYRVAEGGTDAHPVFLGDRILIRDDSTLRSFRIGPGDGK